MIFQKPVIHHMITKGKRREDGKIVKCLREEGAQLAFALLSQRTVRSLFSGVPKKQFSSKLREVR